MHLEKRNTFSNDVIFIDGLWGTGKSLLGPIVSGMDGVERVKVESIYEYVSWLFHLEKIDEDGAVWLLRTYADCSQYHNRIGREINLRWSDDTGLRNAPDKLALVRRLFGPEGDGKVEEINGRNLAYCGMSHMLMLAPDLLLPAYGPRVKVIEMVRHPLYMVGHFASYLTRFESPREFTMACYRGHAKVPWFVQGHEDRFVRANPTERAVLCIAHLYPWLDKKMESSRKDGLALLDFSFEEAVFETQTMVRKLEQFTGRAHHPRLAALLRKQKLPRETISKGTGHAVYGWQKTDKSEREVYMDMLAKVRSECSADTQDEMGRVISWYNRKYPSRLAELT